MPRSPRTVVFAVAQALVAAALVAPATVAAIVLTASPAHAADVNCPSPAAPTLSGGIYQVDDSSHLMWIRDDTTRWDDSYVLTADVDMGTCIWDSPIAPVSSRLSGVPFTGVFDGGGYIIDNLSVAVNTKSIDDSQSELAGFIGFLGAGAVLRDATFTNALVSLDDTTDYDDSVYNIAMIYAGVAVADAGTTGNATVTNVSVIDSSVSVSVSEARLPSGDRDSVVGAIAGSLDSPVDSVDLVSSGNVIVNMNDQVTRQGSAYAGGIAGEAYGSYSGVESRDDSITSSAVVSAAGALTGVVGNNATFDGVDVVQADVLSLSTSGSAQSETYAGGLAGLTAGTTLTDVRVTDAEVATVGGYSLAGGLFGEFWGTAVQATVSGSTVTSTGLATDFAVAGGVVADSRGATLASVTSDATVTATQTGTTTAGAVSVAGGLVGYMRSSSEVMDSLASGNVQASSDGPAAYVYAGGLVAFVLGDSIESSYATGDAAASASGAGAEAEAGGALGIVNNAASQVADVYSTGVPTASSPGDDTVGGLVGTVYVGSVTQSYWNTTTSGVSVSDGGTGLTSAQMQDPASFAGWTIVDGWQAQTYSGSPALPTSPFWGQCDVNSGFPFLLWEYTSSPCAAPPTPPAPTRPPSAPPSVVAVPGDGLATVEWLVPSSSGSFPISMYQVRSTPSSDGCLTRTLLCDVVRLTNGVEYTFQVRALNGAGWGPWSAASNPVIPERPAILITGTRGQVKGRSGVIVDGTTTGLIGVEVTPWFRSPGQEFRPGARSRMVAADGSFTWKRATAKRIRVYFTSGEVVSNRVTIRR